MSVIYSSFLTGGITQSGLKDWAFELYTALVSGVGLAAGSCAATASQTLQTDHMIIKQGFLFRITIEFLSIRVVTNHNAKLNLFHVFWRHFLFLFIRAASTLFMSL